MKANPLLLQDTQLHHPTQMAAQFLSECPQCGKAHHLSRQLVPLSYCSGSEEALPDVQPGSGLPQLELIIPCDILGGAIHNLQHLVQLPYGCGEQNMARLAPDLLILKYLNKTGQLTEDLNSKIIGYLVEGYQTQLKYKHSDGSYSTFGQSSHSQGSTWLTAFVYKIFVKLSKIIFVEKIHITDALSALAIRQKPNGCFQDTGTLLNNAMKVSERGKSVSLPEPGLMAPWHEAC
ncbi:Alpha-1-macroglobulin [Varanus komodoensis]|nr:Alpha-1-macroglobulin [Varanus komodoensis]